MDPRKRGAGLSDIEQNAALNALKSMLENPDLKEKKAKALLEYALWKAGKGRCFSPENRDAFEMLSEKEFDTYTFWNGFFHDSPLATIVAMLESFIMASAGVERYWSERAHHHTKSRNR